MHGAEAIDERFGGGRLDERVWTPAYLPAWSSLREAAATYEIAEDGLRLTIPTDKPLWCPDLHDGPLKVSAVQSGNWSGPVGSRRGQQPFRDGLVVRESQETRWGFTPRYGYVEVQCRATLTERSMFSAWLVGLEDEQDHCGEICIVEVFGDTVALGADGRPAASVGCGVHAFRDPRLVEEFTADPYPIDVSIEHRYAIDWRPGRVEFLVDDVLIKTLSQAPDYPMQLILGVFDFPDRARAGQVEVPVPELAVRRVLGRRPSAPLEVAAWSAPSAGAPLGPTTITRRTVGEHDVLIDVAYVGICHSDIHATRGEWGDRAFPLVPGHEIAGTVGQVGAAVTRHAVGDRVGVGVYVDSCRDCPSCRIGQQQHCVAGMTETYGSIGRDGRKTDGGYSEAIVVDENYVLRIPDGIGLDAAAPLLCAGITVWSPLKRFDTRPGRSIAVVGLGGLGHMAVKIAVALGAEVTVLSRSLDKAHDARRLGADHCYATSDPATFDRLASSFDLVINTVSATLDTDAYLALLNIEGTLIEVGLPEKPISLSPFSLVTNGRSLAGSKVGGLDELQEMLDFCAEHGIVSDVEMIRIQDIDTAYDRMVKGDVKYRFVIDNASLAESA